jgi:hypothetical protein
LKNVPKKAILKNCFYEVITVPDRDPGNCTDQEISGTSLRGCGGETMQAKPDSGISVVSSRDPVTMEET